MNEKFFSLPWEKQWAVMNAGYRVFSRNSYRKSPMGEIAAEAGISKSLLFYYFKNKKDLYLFLWNKAADFTMDLMEQYHCYKREDLFEMMYCGMQVKLKLMKEHPFMCMFVIRAFYEKDLEVCREIAESYEKFKEFKSFDALQKVDPNKFAAGIDLSMMWRDMYLASEGYLWEMLKCDEVDVKKIEKDFTEMIEFWKKTYLKKEI